MKANLRAIKKARFSSRLFSHFYLPATYCREKLDSGDVFSLWAFLALGHSEANFLAFGQGFET